MNSTPQYVDERNQKVIDATDNLLTALRGRPYREACAVVEWIFTEIARRSSVHSLGSSAHHDPKFPVRIKVMSALDQQMMADDEARYDNPMLTLGQLLGSNQSEIHTQFLRASQPAKAADGTAE